MDADIPTGGGLLTQGGSPAPKRTAQGQQHSPGPSEGTWFSEGTCAPLPTPLEWELPGLLTIPYCQHWLSLCMGHHRHLLDELSEWRAVLEKRSHLGWLSRPQR